MVEHAVEHERGVAVGAFDGAAVERRVVVGDERVELEREVIEPRTVGALRHPARHGEALPVAGGGPPVSPALRGIEARDAVHEAGERTALVLLEETPVADVLESPVGDAGSDLLHGVQAEVAAVGEDRGEQNADLVGLGLLLSRMQEVRTEPQVVLDFDEEVGQADGAAAGIDPAAQLHEARRAFRVRRLGMVSLEPPAIVIEGDLPVVGDAVKETVDGVGHPSR